MVHQKYFITMICDADCHTCTMPICHNNLKCARVLVLEAFKKVLQLSCTIKVAVKLILRPAFFTYLQFLSSAFFTYLNFNSLAKLNCLLYTTYVRQLCLANECLKIWRVWLASATVKAKLYAVENNYFLVTLTSRIRNSSPRYSHYS